MNRLPLARIGREPRTGRIRSLAPASAPGGSYKRSASYILRLTEIEVAIGGADDIDLPQRAKLNVGII
jgi:hypothetical protein